MLFTIHDYRQSGTHDLSVCSGCGVEGEGESTAAVLWIDGGFEHSCAAPPAVTRGGFDLGSLYPCFAVERSPPVE